MQPGTPILVVEDEIMIAMMLESFLDELGHPVAGIASSVSEALGMVELGGFGLAILDLTLDGGQRSSPVAEALVARGIPFIVSSGAADRLDGPFAGSPMLAKPYMLSQLSELLDAVPAESLVAA
jgi:CheY-like chemotaxis protein